MVRTCRDMALYARRDTAWHFNFSHDMFVSFQAFFISLSVFWTPFHPWICSVPVTVYSSQSHTITKPPFSRRPLTHCGFVWTAEQLALYGTAFLTWLFICWTSSQRGGKDRGERGQSGIRKKLFTTSTSSLRFQAQPQPISFTSKWPSS